MTDSIETGYSTYVFESRYVSQSPAGNIIMYTMRSVPTDAVVLRYTYQGQEDTFRCQTCGKKDCSHVHLLKEQLGLASVNIEDLVRAIIQQELAKAS